MLLQQVAIDTWYSHDYKIRRHSTDGTINMNATQTKLDEKETYYITLFGDGE